MLILGEREHHNESNKSKKGSVWETKRQTAYFLDIFRK